MSRQNNQSRERKQEVTKRDAASSNERYSRNDKEQRYAQPRRDETTPISGLNRYRLNDLYERSSI
jgi:hypothetical protein